MERRLRAAFNKAYTPALYERLKARLEAEFCPAPFRIAETPVFLAPSLRDDVLRATREILEELTAPEMTRRLEAVVPSEHRAPGGEELPTCMTVDFAFARLEDGTVAPRVVELQAFPSLYALTLVQTQLWNELLCELDGVDAPLTPFFDGFDEEKYLALFREVIVGDEDPTEVVLLDIVPDEQKTRPDFLATEQLLGVERVCVTAVQREGRRLFRERAGRRVPIRRVYNRVVFDELFQKRPPMSFAFSDELDVTFVPHPNWSWMWSKAVLPLLRHETVPRSTLLCDLAELPEDLSRFVLKPLFSFAGAGVNVDPTPADVDAVPREQRPHWLLQEKIDYARDLVTPEGHGVAAEIRVLCLRGPNDRVPRATSNLTRLSRGKMLGVDFNKDFDWVGSTISMWPTGS